MNTIILTDLSGHDVPDEGLYAAVSQSQACYCTCAENLFYLSTQMQIKVEFFCGWDLADCKWDLTEWLERPTVNAEDATVLDSISASSNTVESEGRQMKQCWIKYIRRNPKNPPVKYVKSFSALCGSNITQIFRCFNMQCFWYFFLDMDWSPHDPENHPAKASSWNAYCTFTFF